MPPPGVLGTCVFNLADEALPPASLLSKLHLHHFRRFAAWRASRSYPRTIASSSARAVRSFIWRALSRTSWACFSQCSGEKSGFGSVMYILRSGSALAPTTSAVVTGSAAVRRAVRRDRLETYPELFCCTYKTK
jgi:hypothetical protein